MSELLAPLEGGLRWERLTTSHDRAAFDCGEDSLNVYLHRFARQNASRDLGLSYVGVQPAEPTRIAAYFTLAASQIQIKDWPQKPPSPHPIPAFLLARLAVDRVFQGRGLGVSALLSAFRVVAAASQLGAVYALEVHALNLNLNAAQFYRAQGFTPLLDDALHFYLPIAVVRERAASRFSS